MATDSEVRCHFAARLIAFHVSTGGEAKNKCFLPPLVDNPIFNSYWREKGEVHSYETIRLLQVALGKWPVRYLINFNAWPLVSLMAYHTLKEQASILNILESTYGYRIYGQ